MEGKALDALKVRTQAFAGGTWGRLQERREATLYEPKGD